MKYRTVQTMMLPDCAEENYGLYYQGTGGICLSYTSDAADDV